MLMIAILLFLVAALLGVYLLSFILQHKNTPKGVVFTHGPLAALGLIILILYALCYKPAPLISILLFILATLGGIMLIYRDIIGKSVPKWLAIGHGMIAIIGLIFLLFFAFTK